MTPDLIYLLEEICSGMEIYFTGRTGGQYLKIAFILCDDYTELTSKLYLKRSNASWSDNDSNGRFKSYWPVLQEVATEFAANGAGDAARVTTVQQRMKGRRDRRNGFFHSADLLDLNMTQRMCVEAYCDLIEYGALLFGPEWDTAMASARNMQTMHILLQLEAAAMSDPSVTATVGQILSQWPREKKNPRKTGTQIVEWPEDLHLRMCITLGGRQLRESLQALLTTTATAT